MTEQEQMAQTAPRDIVVTNPSIEYGNVEAWINIIQSYNEVHPEHRVLIFYEGQPVQNLISLFKMENPANRDGFEMAVSAPDSNWKDVAKLFRFLVEGASPRFQQFINKEMYQVLSLF